MEAVMSHLVTISFQNTMPQGGSGGGKSTGRMATAQKNGEETTFDGDGRPAKKTELTKALTGGNWGSWNGPAYYHLYSSVTGKKIMEISAEGEMADTYVYMGDTLIMDSYLRITDPVSGSMRKVNGSGVPLAYDPFGDDPNHIEMAGMGTAVPPVIPETMPAPDYENGGYVGNAKDGCEIEGMPVSCTEKRLYDYGKSRPDFIITTKRYKIVYGSQSLASMSGGEERRMSFGPNSSEDDWQEWPQLPEETVTVNDEEGPIPEISGMVSAAQATSYSISQLVTIAKSLINNRAACRALFNPNVDPIGLLSRLEAGDRSTGSLSFGPMIDPTTGRVLMARAYTIPALGAVQVTLGGNTFWQSTGMNAARIVMSTNPPGPRWGLSPIEDAVLSLVHELGHAANFINNVGASAASTASRIEPDNDISLAPRFMKHASVLQRIPTPFCHNDSCREQLINMYLPVNYVLILFAFLFYATLGTATAFAQSVEHCTLKGRVADMEGSAVAGAVLTISDSRRTIHATTNGSGKYSVFVPSGIYKISVEAFPLGFNPTSRSEISLEPRSTKILNFVLYGKLLMLDPLPHIGQSDHPRTKLVSFVYQELQNLNSRTVKTAMVRYTTKCHFDTVTIFKSGPFLNESSNDLRVLLTYDYYSIFADEIRVDSGKKSILAIGQASIEDGERKTNYQGVVSISIIDGKIHTSVLTEN